MPRRLVLGVALLAGALARPAAAAPCELQGSPQRAQLRVPVRGRAPIDLELNNTAVRARFTGPRASVEVLGPFRIVGAALELPLALARPITAAGGAVHVSTEMEIVRARPHRSQLRLTVDLAPRTTIGAVLSPVVVACDAVKLREEPANDGHVALEAHPSWLARGRTLTLRLRPEGSPRLRLQAREAGSLPLTEVARRGEHIHVRAAWDDGSAVEGWIDRAALTPVDRSGFGYGAWKTPAPPRCARSRQAMPAGGFAGKARLRAGATLHAEPARGAWAEAREDVEVEVELRDLANDAWVRVVVAPGIAEVDACGQLDRAWVARADVTLP